MESALLLSNRTGYVVSCAHHGGPLAASPALAGAMLAAVLTGCGYPEPRQSGVLHPESELLSKVHVYLNHDGTYGRTAVYPAPGVDWRALLEIDPCGPFYSGITFAEAQRREGEPDEIGESFLGGSAATIGPGHQD